MKDMTELSEHRADSGSVGTSAWYSSNVGHALLEF